MMECSSIKKNMANAQLSICWKDPDEIIWSKISCSADAPFKIKDANKLIENYVALCQGKASKFITDLRNLEHSVEQEVVFFLATHVKMVLLREHQVFLTSSLPGWFFASHFTNYTDKNFSCRVFSEEKEAIEWLNSIL